MSTPIPWHDTARALVEKAVLAPSSHNTQPWCFQIRNSVLDLHADRTRALPVNDPDDREMTISCGCALMNVRLAAVELGVGLQVRLFPESENPDCLARVVETDDSEFLEEDPDLAAFMPRRHTLRKRFLARTLEQEVIDRLVAACRQEGAVLHPVVGEDSRERLAILVSEGDAAQWADRSWRRELAAWMHPRRKGDGLTVPALAAPVAQMVVRTFDMGDGVAAKDKDLAGGSPLLAVLTTTGDEVTDWIAAGQALQRVLLTACSLGLQASYLNQPVQVAPLRPKLQNLLAGGFPQIVLRFGYPGGEVSPAPRRPVAEVII